MTLGPIVALLGMAVLAFGKLTTEAGTAPRAGLAVISLALIWAGIIIMIRARRRH